MSKGYILKRLIRSIISIFIIMVIVFTLVYTLVPRNSIFSGDDGIRKLSAKPDDKTDYMYNIWQKLGYLDFVRASDYFQEKYAMDSPEMTGFDGLSLEGSMVSGVISGMLFEIEGYLREHPEDRVVFTGGDANYFAKRMKNSIFVVCNLVLMGLALIADAYVRKMDA